VVTEKLHESRKVYICSTCGLGYDDILVAYACEYHRQYGEPSTGLPPSKKLGTSLRPDYVLSEEL